MSSPDPDPANIQYAYSIARSGTNSTFTVNGVAFAPILVSTTGTYSTTDYAFDVAATFSTNSFENSFSGASAVTPTPTGDLASVLSDGLLTAGNSSQQSDARLTIKGLTSGTHPAVHDRLLQMMKEWRQQVDAKIPGPNPRWKSAS